MSALTHDGTTLLVRQMADDENSEPRLSLINVVAWACYFGSAAIVVTAAAILLSGGCA